MRRSIALFLLLWGSSISFAQPTDFIYLKSLGLVQYYEKNFMEAIFNLQKASAIKPSDKESGNYLRMCYDSVGNKELAGKMRMKMEKFSNAPADNRPVIKPAMAGGDGSQSGVVQRKNGKAPVERPHGSVITDVANDLRQLGDYFMDRESYDSSEMCYKHYLQINPTDSSVLYYLATSQYFLKEYDDAITNYEAALHKEPQRADLYNWIGVCELLKGNYITARDNFKQCIRYDKDYSLAYFNLGKTQYELEDYGGAAKNLEHAQELMPNDLDIIKMLADIYYNTGKYDKSRNMYERLYVTNKKSERINYRLGDLYVRLGLWDKAITYLSNFLELVPTSVDAQKKIGVAYYNTDKFTFAIDNFEKALKTLWDDKELMLYAAISANKLGDYQKAQDYANRAITLDSHYARAYYQLGVAYKGLKQGREARKNFAKADDLEINNVSLNPDSK